MYDTRSSNSRVIKHTIDTPYWVGPVHIYLIERKDAYFLVDTGPPTSLCFSYLKNNLPLDKIEYVFVTHSHADHCGATTFIRDNSDARILMPKKDILKRRYFVEIKKLLKEFLLSIGFPEEIVDNMQRIVESLKTQENIPEDVLAVEEFNLPKGVEYESFAGHSLTDFVYLFDKMYAFTGDFLLSNIFQTPLIEIDPGTREVFNNYKAYCDSISRIDDLNGYKIFPSHRELDSPLEAIEFYVDKLLRRSKFLKGCLNRNCTIFEAVKELFDPYKEPFKAYMKASELVFIKNFLANPELLSSSLKKIGLFDKFEESFEQFY